MWGNVHRRAEFTVIGQYSVYKSGILITFTMVYDHHLSLQSFLNGYHWTGTPLSSTHLPGTVQSLPIGLFQLLHVSFCV